MYQTLNMFHPSMLFLGSFKQQILYPDSRNRTGAVVMALVAVAVVDKLLCINESSYVC
jgi:hypothetical protein